MFSSKNRYEFEYEFSLKKRKVFKIDNPENYTDLVYVGVRDLIEYYLGEIKSEECFNEFDKKEPFYTERDVYFIKKEKIKEFAKVLETYDNKKIFNFLNENKEDIKAEPKTIWEIENPWGKEVIELVEFNKETFLIKPPENIDFQELRKDPLYQEFKKLEFVRDNENNIYLKLTPKNEKEAYTLLDLDYVNERMQKYEKYKEKINEIDDLEL